jgi:hypothetical protein
MITNFKIFEENDIPYYYVGDVVVCIRGTTDKDYDKPKTNNRYLVIGIGKYTDTNFIELDYVTKENTHEECYVDIKDIKTDMILKGWSANRFKSEIMIYADKFNI